MITCSPARSASGHAASLQPRRCLLVLSRLAPEVPVAAVADIFKRSRERHAELEVSGAMLFDGERLCVLLCGSHAQVERAIDAVFSDPVRTAPAVLADVAHSPPWAAQAWRTGWSEPDALACLEAADAPQGEAALELWRALVDASDLL